MHYNGQLISCRKIFAIAFLIVIGAFLFLFTDNTLNSFYYAGSLEVLNNSMELRIDIITRNDNSSIQPDESVVTDNISSTVADSRILTFQNVQQHSTMSFENASNSKESFGMPENEFPDYLVWSPECTIQNLSPFNEEAMKYYHKEKYIQCSKHKLLSYIEINDNKATLHIDRKILPSYTKEDVMCCYSYVTRHGSKKLPDEGIKYSTCTPFQDYANLTKSTVKVSCKVKKKAIYENVHEAITVKDEISKLKTNLTDTKIPSILFVGIDSISRLNLIRAMPKTYEFLVNGSETWYPLNGYNKIGENTFPNLMAIFTGYNQTEAYDICDPKKVGPLDACRFIWKEFKNFGYVTAYGEDETSINTFNYKKKGFIKEPVDHFFRPYMEAAENLGVVKCHSLSFCSGPESSGERIMDLAKNFATAYREYASFGFFWMNTFSHNDINTPSRMDEKVTSFLEDLIRSGVSNNSIIIFLSDHGMRFGKIRDTFTGWLEERLPYIFFSFPAWFKRKFPQEFENFKLNSNKLTTPYDVYMTLQHILTLAGFNYTVKSITACPLCKSLFTEIGTNRSCDSTGITPHWCTCSGYTKMDPHDKIVVKAANYVIGQLEQIKLNKKENKKCAKFSLNKVVTSNKSNKFSYKNDTYILIVIETKPKAVFESTLQFNKDAKNMFSIESTISRLDRYAESAKCVSDENLKQYCFCKYEKG